MSQTGTTSEEPRAWRWERSQDGASLRRWAVLGLKAALAGGLLFAFVFFALVLFLPLPSPSIPEATRIYDRNGERVASLFVENRIIIPGNEIPEYMKKAVIAIEDRRFYKHFGIDPASIVRAIYHNLKAGKIVEGGSTITQQLAKNLFLTPERTVRRKFLEAVYTIKLEMRYSKDEILDLYLNTIYLGHGAYGVEVAARTYFGKPAKDLSLAECALLAGLIRSPETLSPYRNMDRAVEMRNTVLSLMAEQGYISREQAEKAKKEKVVLAGLPKSVGQYFVDYVVASLLEKHPDLADKVYRGGLEIYTTLDLRMQKIAERVFASYMPPASKDKQGIEQPQGALVAIDPSTGEIRAMVGGRDYSNSQLNRAVAARRQPGSAFKIFLYTAVVDQGYPVTTVQTCEPVSFPGRRPGETYTPHDYGQFPYHNAPLNIRQAVAISDNVVAAKWASKVGPAKIAEYARKMGVKSPLELNIPLALGASEVTPLEMARACAVLASGGLRTEPIAILKVVDSTGRVIEQNKPSPPVRVLDEGTAYIVTSLLRSVLGPGGTGESLGPVLGNRPAAGKTGTTDDHLDAWFVGYTPDLACAVYVGWDHREKPLPGTGATVAGPIWAHFMAAALANTPPRDWEVPSNVVWAPVCDKTGNLAGPTCFARHMEVFRKDMMPPVCDRNHILDFFLERGGASGTPGASPESPEKTTGSDAGTSQNPVPDIRPREAPPLPGPLEGLFPGQQAPAVPAPR
ncbi:MAG: PBP1A family penicillin-binding protein [Firmicutes bacterium]|nr:PBP1A family penicillin-binding protein [Candidatus Fermentithermobacillaceae bacterium]